MLEKEVFTFLKLLKQNNNRDWFKKNKHLHDASKQIVQEFSNSLFQDLKKENNLDSVKVFRIYRDIRFSKNKTLETMNSLDIPSKKWIGIRCLPRKGWTYFI